MNSKLQIVADENIPALAELVADVADITFLPGRTLKAGDLCHADALLVRSVTRVNADLLQCSPVRFVGTCTIGTDHVDEAYLQANDIGFSSAPGCNAAAVVDYVMAAIFAVYNDFEKLCKLRVGIVGLGQVGGRLQQRLQGLGIACEACDPYKAQATASMEDVLACDVISLHVPYTVLGEHATHHLFNAERLAMIRVGGLLINTSRGAVVDNEALYAHLQQQRFHAVLDVYEDEPVPDIALLDALDIATAHIAGYSLHGKIRGTMQVVEAMFRHFRIGKPVPDLLSPLVKVLAVEKADVLSLVRQAYDIQADSRCFIGQMRKAADKDARAKAFDHYRKEYPVRYEWSYVELEGQTLPLPQSPVWNLGFRKNKRA